MPGWGRTYLGSRPGNGNLFSINAGDDGWTDMGIQSTGSLGFLVPYHNNMASMSVYRGSWIADLGLNARGVCLSMDGGLNFIDVTPVFDGDRYGPFRGYAQAAAEWGVSDPGNYLNSYGLLTTNVNNYANLNSIIFKRTGYYGEWTFKHFFEGYMSGLSMHPYDATKLYLLGYKVGSSALNSLTYIAYSDDSAESFSDKLGNFETTVGGINQAPVIYFNPIAIRAIGT